MDDPQPGYAPTIQDFLLWKSKSDTRRVGCGGSKNAISSEYIPDAALQDYLTADRIKALLKELFDSTSVVPPRSELVRQNHLHVFAILLCADSGRYIEHFMTYQGLRDTCLPFFDKPIHFPQSGTRDLFKAFDKEQWQFCALQLEYDMNNELARNNILPIIGKEEIGDGGSAVLYKITVDEGYNRLRPTAQHNVPNKRLHPNIFVLKTYRTPEAASYFKNERDAFLKLRYGDGPPDNIIEYYGSFIRDGTYNTILEYADRGDLDEYMKKTPEPKSIAEITMFWERLFAVLRGLVQIHGTQGSALDGPKILLGWHHDIDPSNILVISRSQDSPYDCDFKIADLGLAHFKRYISLLNDATADNKYGTNTYSAPETYRNRNLQGLHLQTPQSADIWSMGCVFSEVSTWVTEGKEKLTEYRRRRRLEISRRLEESGNNTESTEIEDRFHLHSEILDTVKQNHSEIMDNSRRHDYITPCVIERLVKGMVRPKSSSRGRAEYHLETSQDILREAENKIRKARPTPAPTPEHTVSDSQLRHIYGRKPRLPPSVPPDRTNNMPLDPSEALYGFTRSKQTMERQSLSAGASPQECNHSQPGSLLQQLAANSSPRNEAAYRVVHPNYIQTQPIDALSPRPPQRISSHHFSSNPPSQQPERSHTETAITALLPRSQQMNNIPYISESSDATFLPRRPRDATATPTRGYSQPLETEAKPNATNQRHSDSITASHGTHLDSQSAKAPPTAKSSLGRKSGQSEPLLPSMTVSEGLSIKKEKQRRRVKYPGEENFHALHDILKRRDHVFLIDNADSMKTHRPKVERVLELLATLTQPYDPDGLDLYFTTESGRLKPKSPDEFLKYLEQRPAHGQPDFRQRFASIIDHYQSKFGKRNILSKALHPNSTPSKGPRPLSLYVLTDGVWDPRCTLITEIKNLAAFLQKHEKPNKYVGIQFIRFGQDANGKKRLKTLDDLNDIEGLGLDTVDTTSADGNVWKMLFGAVNDFYDDAHDGDTDDEDGPSTAR